MSERKYTDEEIIRALECCRDFGDCSLCPYENATFADELDCTQKLHTDALVLINRQKAEIERLSHKCEDCAGCMQWICDCSIIETEAIKEFAERLKDKARMPIGTLYGKMVYVEDIDNLVAEMTEGK